MAGLLKWAVLAVCLTLVRPAFASGHSYTLLGEGRGVGLGCGIALLLVVGYGLARALAAFASVASTREKVALGAFLAGLAALKIFALGYFPGLSFDVSTYEAWALRVALRGPADTYRPDIFLDYPPGYLYLLWLAGWLGHSLNVTRESFRVLVETPPIIADALIAALIYAVVRVNRACATAWGTMLLFALNPAFLFDTVVWGQSDSVPTLLMTLAVVLAGAEAAELGWAVATLAVLVKPQALFLAPLLAWWTVLKLPQRRWVTSAAASAVTAAVTIAPFQIRHSWTWLYQLYVTTASYYRETSVNAFNLMALVAGMRQSDATVVLGLSWFAWGMIALAAVYGFVAFLLWRKRTSSNLLYCAAFLLFGAFMVAPRMHERYLYPALVMLIPLSVDDEVVAAAVAVVSGTFLVNLVTVKRVFDQHAYLAVRDVTASLVAGLNSLALLGVGASAFLRATREKALGLAALFGSRHEDEITEQRRVALDPESLPLLPWSRIDTLVMAALLCVSAALRFYRLGSPPEIVFDEVHFVTQARHYMHNEPFLDPHPPLAKLVIVLGIALFGDHPWSWRFGNACVGTLLVGITYLLGRRMFRERLVGALAAGAVALDGIFIVDSRVGVIDIVYLTLAALSYLLMFRFLDSSDHRECRRLLALLALALGLCLGSKLYIPAATFILVTGFIARDLMSRFRIRDGNPRDGEFLSHAGWRALVGAGALVGGLSGLAYLATFTPHFYLGWWRGLADIFHYYGRVIWYENAVYSATHPYAAPWWSWPLLLRPIAYWQSFPAQGDVAVIWGGGNPLLWWGALAAILSFAARLSEARSSASIFVVTGYLVYLAIWVPIGRTLFAYHYMPALYLGFLALAKLLADCWSSRTNGWEEALLLTAIAPVPLLALGAGWGLVGLVLIIVGYLFLASYQKSLLGRSLVLLYAGTTVALAIYFLPLWLGLPISRAGYYARMWFAGPGLANWI